MKKSKLWAKFKIREELHRWWGVEGGIDEDGIDDVLKIIEQIEEPEVLSQEWIHENKEMYLINDTSENAVPDYKLQNLLVPEQELPVIPKFVAEWITNHREKFDLYPALKKLEGNPFGWERTYEWYRVNTHEFVNVYLTGGYEVEEEQKYYVNLDTAAYVAKWNGNGQVDIYTDAISGSDEHELHLTEQEIKNYDERFWAFAEPVE